MHYGVADTFRSVGIKVQVTGLLDTMTARFGQVLSDPVQAHAIALKKLWLLAFREAQVQAFADAYLMIAACFALAFVMVPLMQKVALPQTPSAEAH